jgi:aspartyl/glutamyl-tRNA(Asn/Gln) amidotransferase C subunit
MKEVTIDTLKKAADRICIDMTDEQYASLLNEFEVLLKQMDLISQIEGVDEATPMTFPFPCVHTFLREDEPINELSVEEGLKNAPEVHENQIKLPKVVK